jgi:hypothetical protein
MNARAQPGDRERWVRPPKADDRPEPGYDAWLAAEIEAACAELDAGKATPLEKVRKEFGLE